MSSKVRFVSSIDTVRLASGRQAERLEALRVDDERFAAHAREAEAVGEALGGIDGEAEHAPAPPRRAERERRRDRRLADAARARADEDPARFHESGERHVRAVIALPPMHRARLGHSAS